MALPSFAEQILNNPGYFNKSVAIYEYMRGNTNEAIIELASDSAPVSQEGFTGQRKLARMDQIQRSFDYQLAGEMPSALNNALWLDMSALYRAAGDCQAALNALGELRNTSVYDDHEIRLMRVTCMLETSEITSGLIVAAEEVAKGAEGSSINLAYLYNNLANAAQYSEDFVSAQRYFSKALSFVNSTDEGLALKTRIRLNMAWSYYESLQYDKSFDAFSTLSIENEWVDSSLLGYGWAAFKDGNAGLAIEAWRQLVNLPFKSLAVYEAYIAIPFAFEAQNAYSEAFHGYVKASDIYADQINEIDELARMVSADDIREHVIEYSLAEGRPIKPVHPLLVKTFALGNFQDVFEKISELDVYRKRIESFEHTINILDEARLYTVSNQENKQSLSKQVESNIELRLKKLSDSLDQLSGSILLSAINATYIPTDLKEQYGRFIRLQKQITTSESSQNLELKQRLMRLQGYFLAEVEASRFDNFQSSLFDDVRIQKLSRAYFTTEQRYLTYWSMKQDVKTVNVGENELIAMRQRLAAAKARIQSSQDDIDEVLLVKTRYALDLQKQQIAIYENQAQIALARLSEEFYQRGGRKLWR